MFNGAPVLSGDMYGARIDGAPPDDIPAGVTLRIDNGAANSINMVAGPYEGGQLIGLDGASSSGFPELIYFGQPGSVPPIPGIGVRAFQDVKDNMFGQLDKDARELAFHYVVFGSYYEAYPDTAKNYSWTVSSSSRQHPELLQSAAAAAFGSRQNRLRNRCKDYRRHGRRSVFYGLQGVDCHPVTDKSTWNVEPRQYQHVQHSQWIDRSCRGDVLQCAGL